MKVPLSHERARSIDRQALLNIYNLEAACYYYWASLFEQQTLKLLEIELCKIRCSCEQTLKSQDLEMMEAVKVYSIADP